MTIKNAFVLLGCGGIGYNCSELLVRMLRPIQGAVLYLMDGDRIESSNIARQHNEPDVGRYKAECRAIDLERRLLTSSDTLRIIPVNAYLDYDTVGDQPWMTAEHLTIFSGVDNNASRIFLEEILQSRDEATLLSAGNGFEDGQVVLYRRRNGEDIDPLPSQIDPEILDNDGRLPSQIPCDEIVESAPQQVLANALAGMGMLVLWYAKCLLDTPRHEDAFNYLTFDVAAPHLSPLVRPSLAAQPSGATL